MMTSSFLCRSKCVPLSLFVAALNGCSDGRFLEEKKIEGTVKLEEGDEVNLEGMTDFNLRRSGFISFSEEFYFYFFWVNKLCRY
jgi:hypothetical protein